MNDISPEKDRLIEARYQRMTPYERTKFASPMFETARALVESSIPTTLSDRERRLEFVRRMYGDELSEAAMQAYVEWDVRTASHLKTVLQFHTNSSRT